MTLKNYCEKCGCRIFPNNLYCPKCGCKTGYTQKEDNYVFTPPVHNIGFFNFPIDFSPYILSNRDDFEYDICKCGYINSVENEFCWMCGEKRFHSKLSRILKKKSKSKFNLDNILCECGAVNFKGNSFCEMCGKQLHETETQEENNNYNNFDLEFNSSVFCFCGEENEANSQFCKNCGLPLKNYGNLSDLAVLCVCSTLNDITSSFCVECGTDLKNEKSLIICVCGHKNPIFAKFCENCERPLNPKRLINSRIVCSCGEILDWNTEFCSNCGKNIRNRIVLKNSIKDTVTSIKRIFK